MVARIFKFNRQADIGAAGEDEVRNILLAFSGASVQPEASIERQRLGIDCYWGIDGFRIGVEIKTDLRLIRTGNLFLEYRIERPDEIKAGWAHSSTAELIAYYSPQGRRIYFLATLILKTAWRNQLTTIGRDFHGVQNDGWSASGLLFPCNRLGQIRGLLVGEVEVSEAFQIIKNTTPFGQANQRAA